MTDTTGVELTTRDESAPAEANGVTPVESGGEPSIGQLMQVALEHDRVDSLERLVAMKERMEERSARAAFFEALADVQDAMPEIPKNQRAQIKTRSGSNYGYTYAGLEDITRTIRPVLREHGLSYSWDVQDGDDVLHVVCIVRHVAGHEERATFPVPVDTKAAMSAAQKNGAALTYGRRQSLIAVLGLTTTDDDIDGADIGRPSAETITESQAADLDAKIDEVGADKARFLDWLGVESLADIPASDYRRAVKALERKAGAS